MRKRLILYAFAALVLLGGLTSTHFNDGNPFPTCGVPGLPPCK